MSEVSLLHASPFIALPFVGAFVGQRIVSKNMYWYDTLRKPSFSPPKWVFGPVWSALYGCMGAASYLVWRDTPHEKVMVPLAVYGAQLLLNWSWTPVFFGQHKIKYGAMINLGILGGAVTCVYLFRSININASNLMIPYALWTAFASVISVRVAMLNDHD
ncbi:unnamed protein product [Schistosoma rodhaini]|uniref:Putative peripheral-type benzodiazepine receptor n=1 Tax=Schistosoma mansoni TaxID=6183 RepID=G4VJX2_SCHMA|nr:putative peripheral-type benzodiazepine receptor [Schistosoma mansoni]CAH8609486.1 unnamed protein product [Schistosoma rodhaini]|eukprot:XP_018652582.1 putative peripheral-type benzodiazepine receptor [Schistosoma mansoni]